MSDTILGLLFEINADPSKAQNALQQFERSTGKSFERAAAGTKPLDTSLLSNRESVRLLSEEMGVHLPLAVSGAVAEMLPGINAIGPALLGAFAIAEIPRFIQEVKDASEALGGYTKAVRDAENADIDASTAAQTHFTTIAQGTILIAQANAALANLAAKQGNWQEEAKAATEAMNGTKGILASLLGPIGSVISLYRGYKAAVKESSDTENQAAQLRQRLIEQLGQLTKLEGQQHKEAAKTARQEEEAARKADEAWERSTEESYNYFAQRRKQSQEEFEGLVRLSEKLIRAEDRTREVQEETNAYFLEQQARREHQQEEEITKGLENSDRRIQGQFKELAEHAKRLRIEWANTHPLAANITEDLRSMGIEARALPFIM